MTTTLSERSYAERRRRRQVVEAWVREHGLSCPGWGGDAHLVDRFSDLVVAYGHQVLCRRHNGSRTGTRVTEDAPVYLSLGEETG